MVETGGLENRCARKGTGGSNPSPSATQSEVQRNSAASSLQIRERCPFSRFFLDKPDCRERTGRRRRGLCSGFSLGANSQSGFKDGIRRMQCDQQKGFGHGELTFASTLETEVGNRRYLSPFCATDSRSVAPDLVAAWVSTVFMRCGHPVKVPASRLPSSYWSVTAGALSTAIEK